MKRRANRNLGVVALCALLNLAACAAASGISRQGDASGISRQETRSADGSATAAERGAFTRYFLNRGRDFLDIFIIGLERGNWGFSIWFGCLGGGLQHAANGRGAGLRSGQVGLYRTGYDEIAEPYTALQSGNSILLANSKAHRPDGNVTKRSADKKYRAANMGLFKVILDSSDLRAMGSVEISLGLYGGVRLGIDIAEAFDFLLGLFTIDFEADDERP